MQVTYTTTKANSGNMNGYEGAQVWRTLLSKPNDTQIFRRLSETKAISLWSLTPNHADYLIKAGNKVEVNHILRDQNLSHAVMIMNLKKRMDTQKIHPIFWDDNTLRIGHRLNLDQYPTLEIIDEYFDYLLENFPSICKVNTIGTTDGNRTIKVARISNGNPRNKVIMITAGMHAREWIAITSALYLLEGLVTKYDQLPQYIRDQDWVIVPLVNPDGFHYTQTRDRLWRKNRRKLNECVGVDINRNFGMMLGLPRFCSASGVCRVSDGWLSCHPPEKDSIPDAQRQLQQHLTDCSWQDRFADVAALCANEHVLKPNHRVGQIDLSTTFCRTDWDAGNLRVSDECHDAYSGPEPFSEAESKALQNLILRLDKKPNGLIDLHSYGKLIMYPWGAKSELVDDKNLHMETAKKMKEAIFNATGQRYNSGPSNTAVYPSTGTCVDWAYQAGVNLTFAIEAGGDKYGGFLFPPSSIKSIGKEVLAAVKVLAKTIAPQVSHRTWANQYWF